MQMTQEKAPTSAMRSQVIASVDAFQQQIYFIKESWETQMTDDGCNELIFAIITQAAKDYITAKKTLNRHYVDSQAWRLEDCKRFFRSEWFEMMSDVDPEWFMKELDKCTQSQEQTWIYMRKS